MATLADINATLQLQTEAIGRQADAVTKSNNILDAVRQRISDMLKVQQDDSKESRRSDERARKKGIEDKRETTKSSLPKSFMSGFAQGTGFSWLSDFLSGTLGSLFGKGGSLLGLLAGVIGKAAGKLLIWGAIGTLVATFFGDEIKAFVEKFKEYTGIDIDAELEKTGYKEEILAAATLALGALTLGVTKALAKIVATATLALGGGLLSALGFGAGAAGAGGAKAGAAAKKMGFFQRLLKGGGKYVKIATGALALGGAAYDYFSGGRGGAPDVIPPVPKTTTPNPASVVDDVIPSTPPKTSTPPKPRVALTSAQRAAIAAIPDSKLPVGFARNAAGRVINKATGGFAKTSEILDLMKGAEKYAKYAKLLNFLGIAGTVIPALADPAFAIYEGAPEDVIKTQLVGALGSVSGAYLGGLIGGGVGGTIGSPLPGVGTAVVGFIGALGGSIAGAVAGESLAEELSNFLLGKPVKKYGAPGLKPGEVAPFADIMNDPNRPKLNRSGMSSTVTTTVTPLPPTSESTLPPPPESQPQNKLFDINDPLVKAKAPPPGHVGEQGKWQAVGRTKAKWITLNAAKTSTVFGGLGGPGTFNPGGLPTLTPIPSTSGSNLAAANMGAKATYLLNNSPTINNITNNNGGGGGGGTSIMTMPITTRDGGDYRDTIRRYGVQ